MSLPVVVFPDVEQLVTAYLAPRLTGVQVGTEWPANLKDALPLVASQRSGGAEAIRWVTENATLDIDCLAATKAEAHDLAQQVRALLLALPGETVPGAVVYHVQDISGLIWLPDPTTVLPRYTLQLRILLRPA